MKKVVSFLLLSTFALCFLAGCSEKTDKLTNTPEATQVESAIQTEEAQPAQSTPPAQAAASSAEAAGPESVPNEPEPAERTLKMTIAGQEISILIYDTPTANALYEALPMELEFSDFNATEKIAYPPETLPTEGEPDGCDPDTGDLCLYAPWGNLSIFYQDFRYSDGLVKIGRVESGMELLSGINSDFTAMLEKAE